MPIDHCADRMGLASQQVMPRREGEEPDRVWKKGRGGPGRPGRAHVARTCGENLPPAVLRGHVDPLTSSSREANHRPYGASLSGSTNRARHQSAGAKGGPGSYNAYRTERFGEFSSSETAPRGMTSCTKSYDHSIPYEDTRAAHRNRTHLGAFIPCIRGQKQLAVPLTGSAPAIVHHLGSQPVCCRIAPPALTQSIIL